MTKTLLAPLAFALIIPATADVLNVGGPNPDHAQIVQAVNAAVDGDVIRIWPGTYDAFSIDDTDLTLIRATSSGIVLVDGTFRVRNLGAGRHVEMAGIDAYGSDGPAAIFSDNVGSVRIRDADLHGADASGYHYGGRDGVQVMNCNDVEFTYCTVIGGSPFFGEYGGWGAHGLYAQGSNLSIFQTDITGSSGSTDDDPGASGYSGGSGVWVSNCVSFVSGCTLIGGHGGDADFDADWWTGYYGSGGDGGNGIYVGSGNAYLIDNVYQPGLGGWAPSGGWPGTDGVDYNAGIARPGDAKVLRATRLTDDQTAIGLRFEGTPGDRIYVLVADDPGYRLHRRRGPFLVSIPVAPLATPWRFMGEIGASGVLITSFPVADLPPFEHETVHFQGAFIDGQRNDFGSSSWSVVLDNAW